jgi:beta-N-acetylhexosaminidase
MLLTASLFAKNSKKYSMDEKIGQMLMFGFKGTAVNDEWIQTLNKQVEKLKLGGILVINYNVKSPEQIDSLMTFLHQTKPAIPLLFAIDQEGGKVQRLSKKKGFTDYLPAQTVADS